MKSRHLRDETKSIELKNGGCGKSEQGINLFVDRCYIMTEIILTKQNANSTDLDSVKMML